MAIPGNYPLELYRGDTARYQFMLWQDDAKTQPIVLTDAIVKAEIRETSGGATIVLMTTTITEPNIIDMILTSSQSRDLFEKGVWDLQITWPNSDVLTVLRGTISVVGDVTDSTPAAPLLQQMRRRVI